MTIVIDGFDHEYIQLSGVREKKRIMTTVKFRAYNDLCEIEGSYVIGNYEQMESIPVIKLQERAINLMRTLIVDYDTRRDTCDGLESKI